MKPPFYSSASLLTLVVSLMWPTASPAELLKGGGLVIQTAATPSNECPHSVIVLMGPAQTNRTFVANLDGASERPTPVDTPGFGRGTFIARGNQLSVDIPYLGLIAQLTMAHIHGPATAEQAAGVLIGLVPEIPALSTRAGRIKGTVPITQEQIDLMASGMTYVNLHTKWYPAGEIRGQIIPAGEPTFELVATNGQNALVIFDGSTSWDAEGDTLSYAWYEVPQPDDSQGDRKKSKSKKSKGKKSKSKDEPACDPVAELTLQYTGTNQAAVGVAQRNRAVLYFAILNPGDTFTFHGAKRNGDMSPAIDVFIDLALDPNASFDTSGKTILPAGATDGSFRVVSGRTITGGDLCTPPDNGGGCPPAKISELTLRYTGTNVDAQVGVAQKNVAVLFFDILQPGDEFTFEGARKNGDMKPQIGVFVDGDLNGVFDTDGKTAVTVGQSSGDFVVVSGRTIDGAPLCDPASDGRILFGTDVVAERVLSVGQHTIQLEVGDLGCTNTSSVVVTVVKPPPTNNHNNRGRRR